MPRRTNQFQRLIALLNATLAGQSKVTESAMLRDKVTGEEREVDILIQSKAANYEVSIGIEVVAHSRPAGTPWVEKMRGKHENLPIDKLILVSESGFAGPAIKKARFHGIETLTVEQAFTTDWPLLAQLESSGFFQLVTINFKCSFLVRSEDETLSVIDAPLNTLIAAGGALAPVEHVVRTLLDQQQFKDALHPHIAGTGEHNFHVTYGEGESLGDIEYQNRKAKIAELRIGLNVVHRESPVSLATGAYQSTPFVAGLGSSNMGPLHFVLAKKPDGQVSGYLVDGKNVHTLTSSSTASTQ